MTPAQRRYVRSLDSKQLGGENSTTGACDPFSHVSVAGAPNNGIIDPCGLIAHSNFNDSIAVLSPAGVTLDVRALLRLDLCSGDASQAVVTCCDFAVLNPRRTS